MDRQQTLEEKRLENELRVMNHKDETLTPTYDRLIEQYRKLDDQYSNLEDNFYELGKVKLREVLKHVV